MTGVPHTTPVGAEEYLSRFILFDRWCRADKTVRPEAFIPHPYPDLSVTRQNGLAEAELLQLGSDVAKSREKNLFGRADFQAGILGVLDPPLSAVPTPPPPVNHVNIIGWSGEKYQQKILALQIANHSVFKPYVESHDSI